jgi:hypothetical protein
MFFQFCHVMPHTHKTISQLLLDKQAQLLMQEKSRMLPMSIHTISQGNSSDAKDVTLNDCLETKGYLVQV